MAAHRGRASASDSAVLLLPTAGGPVSTYTGRTDIYLGCQPNGDEARLTARHLRSARGEVCEDRQHGSRRSGRCRQAFTQRRPSFRWLPRPGRLSVWSIAESRPHWFASDTDIGR